MTVEWIFSKFSLLHFYFEFHLVCKLLVFVQNSFRSDVSCGDHNSKEEISKTKDNKDGNPIENIKNIRILLFSVYF